MDETSKIVKHPFAFELMVPVDRMKNLDKPYDSLYSDIFKPTNIPGAEYFLIVTPRTVSDNEAWICLDLMNFENLDIEADINFSVEAANFNETVKNFHYKGLYQVGVKLCTTDELFDPEKKYIVDGKLTIKINGVLTCETNGDSDKTGECGKCESSLGLGLWEQENKDFVFLVGDKEITAHKNVLAARSSVFARMFETKMKEAEENKATIEDFPFDIVEAGIKSCYHQTLAPVLALEKKLKLLQFYDKYDIQQLKDKLETYLIAVINEYTVCRLVNASLISNSSKLKEKCSEFLRSCLKANPVSDMDILDKDFAFDFLKSSFYRAINIE